MDMDYVNYVRQRDFNYDKEKFKGLKVPDGIKIYRDIPYADGGNFNLTDIYLPCDKSESHPCIINIHGGAWIAGVKEQYFYYCLSLVKYGFGVVSFNYRLAPENKYPAALCDINKLFGFIEAKSKNYKIDKNNIFAIGDSAGAQLLSEYLIIQNSGDYAKNFDFTVSKGLNIKAVALNCGVYNVRQEIIGKDLVEYLDGRVKNGIDDLKYINSSFPPAYILTGNADFLRDEAKPFADMLTKLNVKNEYHLFGDETCICKHDFQTDIKKEISREANKDEMRFFKEFL